jgi:hypothetical protein
LIKTCDRRTFYTRPVTGWVLDPLISCDEAFPGVLRRALVGSPLRRQGIFIALAQLNVSHPEGLVIKLRPLVSAGIFDLTCPLAIIGKALMTARVRDILRSLYGPVEGLIGTLGRLGFDPLTPEDYRALIEIHTDPRYRLRTRLMRNMTTITGQGIRTLLALKPPYVLPVLVRRLTVPEQVEDFQCSIDLIIDPAWVILKSIVSRSSLAG